MKPVVCCACLAILCRTVSAATNLLANGDFEAGDPGSTAQPLGWDRTDGLGVQWTSAPDGHGKAIRMDTRVSEQAMNESWTRAGLTNDWFIPHAAGNAIAETYGLSLYSAPVTAVSGVTYRISGDVIGPGGAKIWVRGYGIFRGRLTRRYEAVLNCDRSSRDWRHFELSFEPTRHRPDVTQLRVMLYAYYPSGVYWFDNLRLETASHEDGAKLPNKNH